MSFPPKTTGLLLLVFFTINAWYVKATDTDIAIDNISTATTPNNNNKTSKGRFMKKKLRLRDSDFKKKKKKKESEPDDIFVEKKEKDDEPNNKPVCFDEMYSFDKFWLCATYEPWDVNHDKCKTDLIDIEGKTYFINQICDECGDCIYATNEKAKPFCDTDTDYYYGYCRENKPICALLFDANRVPTCITSFYPESDLALEHYCGVDKEIENWMGKKFYWTSGICLECGQCMFPGAGVFIDHEFYHHVNDPSCPEEVPKEREACVGDVRCNYKKVTCNGPGENPFEDSFFVYDISAATAQCEDNEWSIKENDVCPYGILKQ